MRRVVKTFREIEEIANSGELPEVLIIEGFDWCTKGNSFHRVAVVARPDAIVIKRPHSEDLGSPEAAIYAGMVKITVIGCVDGHLQVSYTSLGS